MKAQAQGPGHYHKEAPTLVGPKETLLSVLTFQSADAKLWSPREETKSAYVGLTPLFSKAKGQGGPAGDKTVSSLTSGEADRNWESSPAPPDILSCRQTLVAAPQPACSPRTHLQIISPNQDRPKLLTAQDPTRRLCHQICKW